MEQSNKIFSDFLGVSEKDIISVQNAGGDYRIILTDGNEHFVSKIELIIFVYDKLIEFKNISTFM